MEGRGGGGMDALLPLVFLAAQIFEGVRDLHLHALVLEGLGVDVAEQLLARRVGVTGAGRGGARQRHPSRDLRSRHQQEGRENV